MSKLEIKNDFNFFKTTMPESRPADYYLGCLDGSVFIDFNQSKEGLISLCRISFDGYGCYEIASPAKPLDFSLSKRFLDEIKKDELDQEKCVPLIKEIINRYKDQIRMEALAEYHFLEP